MNSEHIIKVDKNQQIEKLKRNVTLTQGFACFSQWYCPVSPHFAIVSHI